MKINLSDKIIAWLALLSGLTISAVAIWYSVAGLVSIFAAAVIPIIVMGVALEISKLIATVWLKLNWTRAPVFIRTYLLVAIAVLMLITSMGIFGFLSKAHSDAGLVSGDVMAKISVYDEKIKTAKDNIDANRKALKQMDEAVDQIMGRSSDEKGADIDSTVCDAVTHLEYYSGEFDIEWGQDVVYGNAHPWHTKEMDAFNAWLVRNKFDPADPTLSLGYLEIGKINLQRSFGTEDRETIWQMMSQRLDIYSIGCMGKSAVYDYNWNDADYEDQQIKFLMPGYMSHAR
jgi:hypothetical protein